MQVTAGSPSPLPKACWWQRRHKRSSRKDLCITGGQSRGFTRQLLNRMCPKIQQLSLEIWKWWVYIPCSIFNIFSYHQLSSTYLPELQCSLEKTMDHGNFGVPNHRLPNLAHLPQETEGAHSTSADLSKKWTNLWYHMKSLGCVGNIWVHGVVHREFWRIIRKNSSIFRQSFNISGLVEGKVFNWNHGNDVVVLTSIEVSCRFSHPIQGWTWHWWTRTFNSWLL